MPGSAGLADLGHPAGAGYAGTDQGSVRAGAPFRPEQTTRGGNEARPAGFGGNGSARQFPLTEDDFRTIAGRVHAATGIVLGEAKRDLVYGRLARRLRALGCPSFAAYIAYLDGPDGEAEQAALVNAITTNLTGFFREPHHFEALQQHILPALVRKPAPGRRLRLWSAGCSSGEEPYSIAMSLLQAIPDLERWDARILATDIDTNMVAAGEAGLYEAGKAAAIPPALRQRYVQPAGKEHVEMSTALKTLIRFKPLNLLETWPMRGPFDAVFCRNVVIYFDRATQRRLFDRFAELLRPDGWLFIGHSESLFGISDRFHHQGRTIYRKLR